MASLECWLGVCGNLTTSLLTYGSNLSLVLALLAAVPAVATGSLPGVYCAMVLLLIWSSFEAIQPFPQALLQLQQSLEAAGHLLDLPEVEKANEQWQQAVELDIQINHIGFVYEDGHVVYEDFSLSCPAGSHIALVGTSGQREKYVGFVAGAFLGAAARQYHTGRYAADSVSQGTAATID